MKRLNKLAMIYFHSSACVDVAKFELIVMEYCKHFNLVFTLGSCKNVSETLIVTVLI